MPRNIADVYNMISRDKPRLAVLDAVSKFFFKVNDYKQYRRMASSKEYVDVVDIIEHWSDSSYFPEEIDSILDRIKLLDEKFEEEYEKEADMIDMFNEESQKYFEYFSKLDTSSNLENIRYYKYFEEDKEKIVYKIYDIKTNVFIYSAVHSFSAHKNYKGGEYIYDMLYKMINGRFPKNRYFLSAPVSGRMFFYHNENKYDYEDSKFYDLLFLNDDKIFPIEVLLDDIHYNILLCRIEGSEIQAYLYDPWGTESERYNAGSYNSVKEKLFYASGRRINFIDFGVNLKGIQILSNDQEGYCFFFCFLMYYITFSILKKKPDFSLRCIDYSNKILEGKSQDYIMKIILNFVYFIFQNIFLYIRGNRDFEYVEERFKAFRLEKGGKFAGYYKIDKKDLKDRQKELDTRDSKERSSVVKGNTYEEWQMKRNKEIELRKQIGGEIKDLYEIDRIKYGRRLGDFCEYNQDCFSNNCNVNDERNFCDEGGNGRIEKREINNSRIRELMRELCVRLIEKINVESPLELKINGFVSENSNISGKKLILKLIYKLSDRINKSIYRKIFGIETKVLNLYLSDRQLYYSFESEELIKIQNDEYKDFFDCVRKLGNFFTFNIYYTDKNGGRTSSLVLGKRGVIRGKKKIQLYLVSHENDSLNFNIILTFLDELVNRYPIIFDGIENFPVNLRNEIRNYFEKTNYDLFYYFIIFIYFKTIEMMKNKYENFFLPNVNEVVLFLNKLPENKLTFVLNKLAYFLANLYSEFNFGKDNIQEIIKDTIEEVIKEVIKEISEDGKSSQDSEDSKDNSQIIISDDENQSDSENSNNSDNDSEDN
jgi:hypothetical protein